jgi:hypothetical protein
MVEIRATADALTSSPALPAKGGLLLAVLLLRPAR